jgi:hypothetical protein
MIWLLAHPLPSLVSKLCLFQQSSFPVCRRSSFLTARRGGGGGGAKSDVGGKAWSSINHAIFSGGKLLLTFKRMITLIEFF